MTETDIAYIAGLFDGEGSVSFGWRKATRNGKRYGKLYARISQNDRRVLDWIRQVTGFGSVHARKRKKWRNLQHDYCTAYEATRLLLAMIRPYLKVKGETVDEKLQLDALHCKRRSGVSSN
jgi:hypothetical protein